MSSYLELMQKRISAGNEAVFRTTQLCLDTDKYNELREEWDAAKAESQAARIRHSAVKAKNETGQGETVKMNAENPVKIAAKEMDAAEKLAAKAKDAVQATFVKVFFKGLGQPELLAVRVEAQGDNDVWTRTIIKKALMRVENNKGEVIPDITAEVLADFILVAPSGDWTKLANTIDEASAGIDFPT